MSPSREHVNERADHRWRPQRPTGQSGEPLHRDRLRRHGFPAQPGKPFSLRELSMLTPLQRLASPFPEDFSLEGTIMVR